MGKRNFKSLLVVSSFISLGAIATGLIPNLYARLGLTDFDQRWNSLPGDGNMYCLPTSFLNLMTYMHTHGAPEVPDLANLPIDERLAILGVLFGTDAEDGTTSEPAHTYMVNWVGQSSNPIIFSFKYGPSWNWGTYRIRQAISSGSMVNIAYGRYDKAYPGANFYVRTGGHVVTLKGYDFNGATDILFVRDPARDDGNGNVQGPYADYAPSVKNRSYRKTPGGGLFTHAEYALDSSTTTRIRIVDGMFQYMPAGGGWSNSQFFSDGMTDGNARKKSGPERIFVKVPFQFTPEPGEEPLPDQYEVIPREEVVDWVFDLGNLSVYYVTKLGRIFEVDLTDDKQHRLLHVIKGTTQLMVGGKTMDLYAMVPGDGSVRFGDGSVRIVRIERDDNSLQTRQLPFKARAMEYDPRTGGPAILADSLDRMVSLDETLQTTVETPLPDMPAGGGTAFFRINPETGWVFYGRRGSSGFQVADRDTGRVFFRELPGVSDLRTVVPIRENLMIVQDGSILKTLDALGNRSPSQFDGIAVNGGIFKMNRSHIAAEPNFDSGPGWRNLRPDELDD